MGGILESWNSIFVDPALAKLTSGNTSFLQNGKIFKHSSQHPFFI